MTDSGERPSVRMPLHAVDACAVSKLHAEAEALRGPVKVAFDPRRHCKQLAIDAWKRACRVIGEHRTHGANAIDADESTLREWETLGARKLLPAWAIFALPREAKLEVVRALLESIRAEELRNVG